ncbi:MAG TPA: pantoate--beta-alanine ligase [Bryobacteraceae bacterium]|nr:pantoate--beta-alanine ligase [Bryobacteraceae bacterium]
MLALDAIADLRKWRAQARRPLGLVPTMGALHAGHGRLIEEARAQSASMVVSIFVNPTQFNQREDYAHYPRPLAADLEFCAARGVDLVFAPAVEEMYPQPQVANVEMGRIADHMEGRFRPGHFRGVATVVLKLFQIVQPDGAWFGEKDAQQLVVIRRMVADLNVPVGIVGVPTVREPDGLALSSRNRHLSEEERMIAPRLYQALRAAERAIGEGQSDAEAVKRAAGEVLDAEPRIRIEYLEVADDAEMQPVPQIAGPVRVAAAVWLGQTRLIDNIHCQPPLNPPISPFNSKCN